MSSNPTPELDLVQAGRAYREAVAPLDSLRAKEKAAYNEHVDARGVVTGAPGSYQAHMDAIGARQEQEGLIHQARATLCAAALLAPSESETKMVTFELLDLRQQMQTLIWHSATLLPPDLYWVQQWQKRMGRIAHALGADLATLPHGREATLDKPESWLMSLTGLIGEPEVVIPLDLAREIGLIVRHHIADLACNNETGERTESVKRAEVAFNALVQKAWEAQQSGTDA